MRKLCIKILLVTAAAALLLTGCYSPVQGPMPLPDINIGVAGFTQPTTTAALLAGYIPENQQEVDNQTLRGLDEDFAAILAGATARKYVSSEQGRQCQEIVSAAQQGEKSISAFEHWLRVGRCMEVDYLLVPHLIDWHQRKGENMTAASPASVTLDLFLMDVQGQSLVSRYHFEETQQTLADNLLEFSKFVERKGKWITAEDLAREGLYQGIKELGL
ncbi:putative lipoprotein [Oleidesulfovibrio alaskensis G20]|jgi:hypothetical protein|uniref:Putative lipoprotein n=1 Tax=Oleidesulfovibrio alaskensis (strain ATCC BAA-1058 / DSM 17464 / G20) TaxID=207559 RepID=Q311Y1_OLEA2|nr:hypothetical protein [Oleidesulfovibrio alaskensis]ABB38265.1 putative lipoprotein [Oleidesulfovibrio alaskensis G20]MBG0774310.1 hypothetical protein [Oleidesulfovibrio alaskensis]MBL3581204.1 hypothetical protein [Oleidesulfovibrio alaskensis]